MPDTKNGGEEILLPQPPRRPEMQLPRWVRTLTIALVVLAAVLVLWSTVGDSLGVSGLISGWDSRMVMALFVILTPTIFGTFFLIRGAKYLAQGCAEHHCSFVGRFFNGNPTVTPIRITQFGIWFVIVGAMLPIAVSLLIPPIVPGYIRLLAVLFVIGVEIVWILPACLKVIPSTPEPHLGLYQWFEARTDVELQEGTIFLVPYIESTFLVNMRKRELNVEILRDLFALGNADMRARMQVPYMPDAKRLSLFVQFGEDRGVALQVIEVLKERMRRYLLEKTSWEVRTRTILRTFGVLPDGTARREPVDEEYQAEPWEVAMGSRQQPSNGSHNYLYPWLIESLTGELMTREQLLELAEKGTPVADNHRWGIVFLDLNVTTLVPTGATKDAADQRAKEAAEADAEVLEKETESRMAIELVKYARQNEAPLGYLDALAMVLEHKTAREGHGFAFPGLPKAIAEVAKAFFAGKAR